MTVAGARVGSGASHAWPLTGRDQELERIASVRTSGACPAVVVTAPAGIGKSRLAREAVAAAADAGAMVCWVQGTPSAAAVPLAACAEMLPPDARADDTLLQHATRPMTARKATCSRRASWSWRFFRRRVSRQRRRILGLVQRPAASASLTELIGGR